jgi:hypothetical protein
MQQDMQPTMQQDIQSHLYAMPGLPMYATQSHLSQLEGQMYTAGTLSCQANEFHPDRNMQSERNVLPYAFGNPAIPAASPYPNSVPPGLLEF